MEINGQHMGTSSIGRGLARHRAQTSKAAKDSSDKAAHPKMPAGDGEDGGKSSTHDHAGEAGSHEMIQQTTSEHGPATSAEVSKSGEHHMVKTTHEDGHTHTSKGHPSVSHVAEHLQSASGNGGDEGTSYEREGSSEGASGLEDMGLGGE